MRCRLAVDALIQEATVIDALLESFAFEDAVGMPGP